MVFYKDGNNDPSNVGQYNLLFFTTPNGVRSFIVRNIEEKEKHVLSSTTRLRIALRRFEIEGTPMPAYSISDHLFVLSDGTQGRVSLFEGAYLATFDGDTFDSPFTRVEGIASGEPVTILKANQQVWIERTGPTGAVDVSGSVYAYQDGKWVPRSLSGEMKVA